MAKLGSAFHALPAYLALAPHPSFLWRDFSLTLPLSLPWAATQICIRHVPAPKGEVSGGAIRDVESWGAQTHPEESGKGYGRRNC